MPDLAFPRSDNTHGMAKPPQKMTEEGTGGGSFDLVSLGDPMAIRWRQTVGAAVAEALHIKDPASHTLTAFPHNYGLFRTTRKDGHRDHYLIGSPHASRFRSYAEFIPHAIWLFTDDTLSNSNCECRYCSPKPRAERTPRKRKVAKEEEREDANDGTASGADLMTFSDSLSKLQSSLISLEKPMKDAMQVLSLLQAAKPNASDAKASLPKVDTRAPPANAMEVDELAGEAESSSASSESGSESGSDSSEGSSESSTASGTPKESSVTLPPRSVSPPKKTTAKTVAPKESRKRSLPPTPSRAVQNPANKKKRAKTEKLGATRS